MESSKWKTWSTLILKFLFLSPYLILRVARFGNVKKLRHNNLHSLSFYPSLSFFLWDLIGDNIQSLWRLIDAKTFMSSSRSEWKVRCVERNAWEDETIKKYYFSTMSFSTQTWKMARVTCFVECPFYSFSHQPFLWRKTEVRTINIEWLSRRKSKAQATLNRFRQGGWSGARLR